MIVLTTGAAALTRLMQARPSRDAAPRPEAATGVADQRLSAETDRLRR